jgi:hypothetical protein
LVSETALVLVAGFGALRFAFGSLGVGFFHLTPSLSKFHAY